MRNPSAYCAGCALLIGLAGCTKSSGNGDGSRNHADGSAGSDAGSPTGDTSIHTVKPDDTEHLLYSGRIDFTNPKAPVFSAPGVSISARFTGVSVSVLLGDEFRGVNYANVVVDGTQYKVRPQRNQDECPVVSGLPYAEHTVQFSKRTEASEGQMTFKGFKFGGAPLPAPARPKRRIEIIGDSISCGSGAEGLTYEECSEAIAYENAAVTFGAVLARNLEAEYQITAVSGIGTIRNYNCADPNTMPKVYDRLFLQKEDSPSWDTSRFVPDAIIIALGTNDFSPDNCRQPPLSVECDSENYELFISTLGEFVGSTLRDYYPKAHIFLTSSPLLGDGWPEPYSMGDIGTEDAGAGGAGAGGAGAGDAGASTCPYTSRTSHIAALERVMSDLEQAGDSKVHLVDTVPKVAAGGCTGHPTAKEHSNIGGTCASNAKGCEDWLLNPIKEVMGW